MADELQRAGVIGAATIRAPISGTAATRLSVSGMVSVGGKQAKELRFLPYSDFPSEGRADTLYIDTDGNAIYYWGGQAYIELSGGNADNIIAKTTAQWDELTTLVSTYGTIYIYTDYRQENNVNIPAIKIGDGNAYVVDLPYFSTGVTEADRARWDNKVAAKMNPLDAECLILYTD